MSSIFGKDPANQPVPDAYARERIEKEIAHLKNKQSTRHGPNEQKTLGVLVTFLIIMAIVGLYVMDPFFYSWYKGDAIKAYLYLHNYAGDKEAHALAATGILTESDIDVLNDRHGSFQDYYPSLEAATTDANTIIAFMNGIYKLHHGPYDELDTLGKVRYNMFCRWGLMTPTEWDMLNPALPTE